MYRLLQYPRQCGARTAICLITIVVPKDDPVVNNATRVDTHSQPEPNEEVEHFKHSPVLQNILLSYV